MSKTTQVERVVQKQKVSITLPPAILSQVDERAEDMGLARSVVIQLILREYFRPLA